MKKISLLVILIICSAFFVGCKSTKPEKNLKGKWVAPVANQMVYQIDSGISIGGNIDYLLECNEKNLCTLYLDNNNKVKMNYKINDDDITFVDENNLIIGRCKINSNEINCNETIPYASKFIKK